MHFLPPHAAVACFSPRLRCCLLLPALALLLASPPACGGMKGGVFNLRCAAQRYFRVKTMTYVIV